MDFDYTTETITPDLTTLLTIGGTGGLEMPEGTTLQRPGNAASGTIRFNTNLNVLEANVGGSWIDLGKQGTVTSLAVAQPASGLTISGGPISTSGTLTFALANDLAAIEGLSSTGIAVRTAADTWAQRSIVGPAAGITVSNGNGVSGNPTIGLVNDLAAVEGLGTTGLAVRTAADTWTTRSLVQGRGITITNADGVAGNITINSASVLQVVTGSIAPSTGTTQVPFDGTTPLSTEGFQIFSAAFTPLSATSRIIVQVSVSTDHQMAARTITASLFRGTTNIGAAFRSSNAGGGIIGATPGPGILSLLIVDQPGSTATQTYSMRIGADNTGTTYVNRGSGDMMGNSGQSYYMIMEVA